MTNDQSIVIRAKDGTEIDLDRVVVDAAYFVQEFDADPCTPLCEPEDASEIIAEQARIIVALKNALVAALSVPRRDCVSYQDACEIGHGNADDGVSEGENIGWNDALDEVAKAAGVVERGEG